MRKKGDRFEALEAIALQWSVIQMELQIWNSLMAPQRIR